MTILEFGHGWLPFTFLVSGFVTVHTTQKCRVELEIGAFLSFTPDTFSFVQSFTVSPVFCPNTRFLHTKDERTESEL